MTRKQKKSELLGKIARERGYLTSSQLERGLADQRQLRAGGAEFLLGQILVHNHDLSPLQLQELLAAQGRARACGGCGHLTEVLPGKPAFCHGCGRDLGRG